MKASLRARHALQWVAVLAATTAAMVPFRGQLEKAHIALVLLLVVLGAGAQGGRTLGISIGVASFVVFDWYFLPPYRTFVVTNPLDYLVLVVFLIASVVSAQLLHREQQSARRARERAREVDRLAALGAEALNAPRADDALAAVAHVIRTATGMDSCEVYLLAADGPRLGAASPAGLADAPIPPLVEWTARERAAAAELEDGTSRLAKPGETPGTLAHPTGPRLTILCVPLMARGQMAGVLRVRGARIAAFDATEWRFLDALAYYAALGAERVRLAAEADLAEQLREADRLKDALIASVSHDLRTPLTTIKALAHDLGELGDERSQVIEEQADRLNRYVSDLLDLSRLSAGAMAARVELNAVDDLLSAALQDVEGRFKERVVEVSLPRDGALLVGRFDLTQSVRVLVNLIENAFKYSPPASTVCVDITREGTWLLITVSDRGPGIAPAEVERIFTPFYRPPGASSDAGSAGLGLAIARQMAEAQGGGIGYVPREGGGSCFTLSLPAADATDEMNARAADLPKRS